MIKPRIVPLEVSARQIEASDPSRSAWVAANAGSGKTHVLAQRVIRLLLSGADPERLLCITFTKAAAANMANRVFGELRRWTLLDDATLNRAIEAVGVKGIDGRLRQRARRLFALTLETPGGLKVQTIHAFCTQLLHRFPFEANVAARFDVLDEAAEKQLLEQISLGVMLQAAGEPESALGQALAQAAFAADDRTFQDMVRETLRHRDELLGWIEVSGGLPKAIAGLSKTLGVGPETSVESIDASIVDSPIFPPSEWDAAADVLAASSSNDQEQAKRLKSAKVASDASRISEYLSVFLTQKNEPRKNVITGTLAKQKPLLSDLLNREQSRVVGLYKQRVAAEVRDRSGALFAIAHAVLERFRAEKNRRGRLDYDDLIDKTLDLLNNVSAAWVHYKLDRGIHHVLIDEAQDTSPKQWEIVKALVSEFFAGAGAHDRPRTIFAVGDEKQSIFSFQGAAPLEFAEMRRHFELAHERAQLGFIATEFKHSFRSGPNVLGAVDSVFARVEAYAGLTADPVPPVHEALPEASPGLVEIWDLEQSDDVESLEGWAAPLDTRTATSATVKLARRIAGTVAAWLRQGRRAQDVLVLVRRRSALFEAIIRALKNQGLPVAGADRLVLTGHIAVMDLIALADAVLLPSDDLALATVLKSPLFGLDDDSLFHLAWDRPGNLHQALCARQPALAARFNAIAEAARRQSPFGFYAGVLGRGGGRRKILARLGQEAADALDEFLNLALDYERSETPTLQGFVAWLRKAEAEVKRDMELARDEVRVMTVHGAKGLEAPIVILADTTTPPEGWHPPRLLTIAPGDAASGDAAPGAAGCLVWARAKTDDSESMAVAREAALDDARHEYRRLLYVAMTRAIDRLIVCGIENSRGRPKDCWYDLVFNALQPDSDREPADYGDDEVWRFRKAAAEAQSKQPDAPPPAPSVELPAWLTRSAEREEPRRAAIKPSGFAEEPVAAGPSERGPARERAIVRGRAVHRLIQFLPEVPPERRDEAAKLFLSRLSGFDEQDRGEIAKQVLRILANPDFAMLFGPGSRAEVSIAGHLHGRPVSGQVDRLAVTPDTILIADYKTNRPAPRSLDEARNLYGSYIAQLALYRHVLSAIYPDRPVRMALLWTETPELMEIPSEVLDESLNIAIDRMRHA